MMQPLFSITPKFRFIWLLNNVNLIFHFIHNQSYVILYNLFSLKSFYLNEYFLNLFFSNLSFVCLKKIIKPVKSFWTTNFPMSLRYWFIKLLLSSEKYLIKRVKQLNLHSSLQLNQYYLEVHLSNISLKQKYYRRFLMTILIFMLSPWLKFNKSFLLPAQFYPAKHDWKLFIFYKLYFFKIFNI